MHTRLNEFHFLWKVLLKHTYLLIQIDFLAPIKPFCICNILQLCTTDGLLISGTQHELLKLIKHKNLHYITKLKRIVTSEIVLFNTRDKTLKNTKFEEQLKKMEEQYGAERLTLFSQFRILI